MSYFLYPEQENQLDITVQALAENGVKFRIKRDFNKDFDFFYFNVFSPRKNYTVEIFCDYDKFTFMKYLISNKLDNLIHLEKCLKAEYKNKSNVS